MIYKWHKILQVTKVHINVGQYFASETSYYYSSSIVVVVVLLVSRVVGCGILVPYKNYYYYTPLNPKQ